jgi:tetratricopeptide (TPR) repeat protein
MKLDWLAVAALMVGLYGVDKSLASLEMREVNAEARGHYQKGQKLLASGKAADAADEFRRAHTLQRTNRDFEIALAGAQLTAGRPEEAEQTLSEVLNRNSNDGRANLLMARVRTAQSRFDDAVPFYHRAIYGGWPDGSAADPVEARLELADQLAQRNRSQELLSELLLLDDESSGDPRLARKVAGLYLEAGSAARAEAAYRAILREDPNDADAEEGLGQAELRRGDYYAAHAAFSAAVRLRPDDAKAPARLQLVLRLMQLDPTSRRLGSVEKFRRSQQILDLAEKAALDCVNGQPPPEPLPELLATSAKLRSEKAGPMPSNEAAETRLELAVQLWKARPRACQTKPADEDPLAIIIAKMEQ